MTVITDTIVTALFIATALYFVFDWVRTKRRYQLPPGPLLNWTPFVGYLPFMTSAPHLKLCELAKHHGDLFTVRFGGYDIVVLNTPSLIKQTFNRPEFSGRPNYLLAMHLSKQGLTFASGREALEQRRFVLKTLRDIGFSKNFNMETRIQEEVVELVKYLRTGMVGGRRTMKLQSLFGLSVINALWSVLASKKFDLCDEYAREVYDACIEGFIDPPVSGALWFLPTIAKLFPTYTGYKAVVEAIQKLKGLVREVVMEHKREIESGDNEIVGDERDFVDAYLNRISEEQDPTSSFYGEIGLTNLIHTLIDLFTAGSDTLNSTLNFAIKYLCENPHIQSQIHDEIDSVIMTTTTNDSSVVTIPYSEKPNLPLLEATMKETLRLSSIVTNGILHSTLEPTTIESSSSGVTYKLGKDTIVMANLYWVHHNPELWADDPDKFDPYRFIGSTDDGNNKGVAGDNNNRSSSSVAERKRVVANTTLLMPFSTGKRVCIAEQMAQVELFCFLGGLLANFRFEGVDTGKVKSGLVLNVDGLVVKVIERRRRGNE